MYISITAVEEGTMPPRVPMDRGREGKGKRIGQGEGGRGKK
jgi:hypothetical protein